MSRLLNERLQQHNTPGVLPYDQIQSVPLVDAKCTQSVQTVNPVALTQFLGRISRVQGIRQRHDSGSHNCQSENVLLLVIFQTYSVSSHHAGHSYCLLQLMQEIR